MALERYSIDLVFRCTGMSELCVEDTPFVAKLIRDLAIADACLLTTGCVSLSHSFTRSLDGPNDKGVLFDKAFWIEMFRIVHTLSWATWWMMSSSWTLSYIHGPVARCSAVKLQSTLENVDSGLRYTSLYSPTTCSTRGIFERPLLGSVNVQAAAYHIYIYSQFAQAERVPLRNTLEKPYTSGRAHPSEEEGESHSGSCRMLKFHFHIFAIHDFHVLLRTI